MSLVLNALPDLHSEIASLRRELEKKNLRLAEVEEELTRERNKNRTIEAGAEKLRNILDPLVNALAAIYGRMEAIGIDGSAPANDSKREVWESWKQKLGGLTAKAIDVLMLHGPMNQTQLRIQLACASRSVTNIVGALNKAGLINKVDGKIALKEL
jgi:hypothetical protein